MNTLITSGYGKADPSKFNAKYVHKYFCDVVQGDVSNDVRQENSVSCVAGTWCPTGSIAFIDNGMAVASVEASDATKAKVPQIVFVGSEHGNVYSEAGNSGCGLITTIPLTAKNTFMTTVYDASVGYTKDDYLTVKKFTFNGKEVLGVTKATQGPGKELIVGIVKAAPGKTHYSVNGIMFDAHFVAVEGAGE